ncbi:hypothetical protein ACIO1C_24680 [Streptomyces sp. NPDC087420]|uniref:hypothetical protein n=1 Tax=Streptomyces sp. NPDC087420 TaxID=3365785 RepID=UPI003836A209
MFWLAFRGLGNNNVYITSNQAPSVPSIHWSNLSQLSGIELDSSPVIASLENGDMLVSARGTDGHLWNQLVDRNRSFRGWQAESQGWQTNVAPFLAVANGVISMVIIGQRQGAIWWKTAYRP